jgi:hypothetical protein
LGAYNEFRSVAYSNQNEKRELEKMR